MPHTLTVYAPVGGAAFPLEQVPDPVFSEHMLGDGIAIDPAEDIIIAPFDGKIIHFNKESHALVIGQNGVELMIHVGLETVNLKGEGFSPLVKTGDSIKKGQPLLQFDPEVLAKKQVSPFVIIVVTNPAEVLIKRKAEGLVQAGNMLFEVSYSAQETKTDSAEEKFTESRPLTVINPNGLHARPAGRLAQAAMKYPFEVEIVKGKEHANAKSVLSIMSMGLGHNDVITLRAGGPESQAKNFLAQMETCFKEGFGEEKISLEKQSNRGILTVCGGLACGKAFVYTALSVSFEENAKNQTEEKKRLKEALQTKISETKTRIATAKNEDAKNILRAHLSILQDPELTQAIQEMIAQGKTAAYAIDQAMCKAMALLRKTGNSLLIERVSDLKDLRQDLLLLINGEKQDMPSIPKGCIVIADELLPSEAAALEGYAAGVLLAHGSPTAHTSILLRNMGIPALVQAGEEVLQITAGTMLCLDAEQAVYTVHPTAEQLASFKKRLETRRAEQLLQRQNARKPAKTLDGTEIRVEGNVSNEKEAIQAISNGADGLGLVRTEFLFHGKSKAPSLAEQQAVYQAVLNAAQNRPVTFRLLDAGGDKPIPYVNIPREENPIVGVRGIRAFKYNEEFFRTQLRAMLSLHQKNQLRILLPMVTFEEEIGFFNDVIRQEKNALGLESDVETGIMIEVPSAALLSSQMARKTGFFSIGTNDLTQYTLAIDRGHPELSSLSDPLHPAVLKLIGLTCSGAKQYGKPVSVCGAMAGDLAAIPFLIGLGVTELAVGASLIAPVKTLIRRLEYPLCAEAARKALELADAQEVRALARSEFGL